MTDEGLALLGPLTWRVQEETPQQVVCAFDWVDDLANPDGVLHGGAIAASLDEALGRLAQQALGGEGAPGGRGPDGGADRVQVLDRTLAFERAGRGKRFVVTARPRRVGGKIAFLEADLADAAGSVCARAQATASRLMGPGGQPAVSLPAMDQGPDEAFLPGAPLFAGPGLRPEILARANPFRDAIGVHLAMPSAGRSVMALRTTDGHRKASGAVHAGVLLTLMDLGMGHALLSGVLHVERPITISLAATTPYVADSPWIQGTGRLLGRFGPDAGSDLYELAAEVHDPAGRTLARARAVFQGR